MPQAQPLPRTAPGARSLPVRKGRQQLQLYITPAGCCTDAFLPLDHWSVKQLGWVEPPKALFFAYHPLREAQTELLAGHLEGCCCRRLVGYPLSTKLSSRDLLPPCP